MRINLKSKKLVAAAVAGTVLTGGGAYAYWSGGGAGSGSATTGSTTSALVANQTSVVSAMSPGSPAQALSGTFTNPTDAPVWVTSLTATVTDVTGEIGEVACATNNFVVAASPMTINQTVITGTAWSGATLAMTNTGSNQDACKNVTAVITYAIA